MSVTIRSVLISDPVDASCADLLVSHGILVTTKNKLSKEELIEELQVNESLSRSRHRAQRFFVDTTVLRTTNVRTITVRTTIVDTTARTINTKDAGLLYNLTYDTAALNASRSLSCDYYRNSALTIVVR